MPDNDTTATETLAEKTAEKPAPAPKKPTLKKPAAKKRTAKRADTASTPRRRPGSGPDAEFAAPTGPLKPVKKKRG